LRDKLVRRTKTQVLEDFPEKLPEEIVEVEMLPKQARAYKAAQTDFLLDVQGAMAEADTEKRDSILEALRSGDLNRIGREIPNAAARISFMRQIATSPALMDGDDVSSKLDACQEKINDHSGKQFVVACWHKLAAETLAARLRRQKPAIECEVLHGDVAPEDRTKRVDAFQNGDIQVLISTIAVGGVGITLTSADTILFIEEDWVPANNRQMEDRLYRIGQKNNVTVIKYRSKNTVDTLDIAPANALKSLIEAAVLGEE
jgi:SNF2 family DNA or RNA helicase